MLKAEKHHKGNSLFSNEDCVVKKYTPLNPSKKLRMKFVQKSRQIT